MNRVNAALQTAAVFRYALMGLSRSGTKERLPTFPPSFSPIGFRRHSLGVQRHPRRGAGRAGAAGAARQDRFRKPYVAIQVGAVSFVDEGVETVLDNLREKAHVNTVWLNTYTWDFGTGGRQLAGYPFPDHGPKEPDKLVVGAFFDYDQKYFRRTVLNQFRAPDYGGRNILAEVLPKAKERNMDVIAWDFFFPTRTTRKS